MTSAEMTSPRFKTLLVLLVFVAIASSRRNDEEEAEEYLRELDESYSIQCNLEMTARWDYITDVENEEARKKSNDAAVEYFIFQSEAASNISNYNYEKFDDVTLYRKARFQADAGPGGLNITNLQRYKELQEKMETIYSTATICAYNETEEDCSNLKLEPDIETIMATSRDWEELKHTWEAWRDATGKAMRDDYVQFVELSNEAAVLDGYSDTGDYWLNGYTVTQKEVKGYDEKNLEKITQEDFRETINTVWEDVFENLYKPLHAFVRMKLADDYPDHIDSKAPLPAHVLGDMWAQDWSNIANLVAPFPNEPMFDVTDSMVEQEWTINKIFEEAEDFFASMGLFNMTRKFWNKSVLDQEAWNKTMLCQASAEDFCLGSGSKDFRIKMCTSINMNDLITAHHEMGHIEYFMAYREQPHVFRDSANPGFHEAIGELIALSVSTPNHLKNILHLEPKSPASGDEEAKPKELDGKKISKKEKREINFLMKIALEKIAFLPFAYLMDLYRWKVFDGSIEEANLNRVWWQMRSQYQGIVPPGLFRGEEYFDPGAKYHVPAHIPYIRYFVSSIVQFQFHEHLCKVNKSSSTPLHECDLYENKDVGSILKSAMEEGLSKPWPLVLKELAGTLEMKAKSMKTYFEPLMSYLKEQLEENNQEVGWITAKDVAEYVAEKVLQKVPAYDVLVANQLRNVEKNVTEYLVNAVTSSWDYVTNVTNKTEEAMNDATNKFIAVYKAWHDDVISDLKYDEVETPQLRRELAIQKSIGTAALDPDDLKKLNAHISSMTDLYEKKICSVDDMKCDEDEEGYDIHRLEAEMATNRQYSELLYYWDKWRQATGDKMVEDYEEYVTLMNVAAKNNNFTTAEEMWLYPYTSFGSSDPSYTSDDFRADVDQLWRDVLPYYEMLHGYVRFRLKEVDDFKKYVKSEDLIPAHILGNMWAESWENVYDLVKPFPDELPNITDALKNSSVETMFSVAEEFYKGIDLFEMTEKFKRSLKEKPEDREVICYPASAWDFYSTESNNSIDGDFRLKICSELTQEDLLLIHAKMGVVEYQMAYSNDRRERSPHPVTHQWPLVFRRGANPGFEEAIGDALTLSVQTPNHLKKIEERLKNKTFAITKANLDPFAITKANQDPEPLTYNQTINFLMKQALTKIPMLSYAYILDQWRWEVFNETFGSDMYQRKWWEKRIDYQGIKPGIVRYASGFDMASKYHVGANLPYISNFVGRILQFQMFEKLCNASQHEGNMSECDLEGEGVVGQTLLPMLEKGASEHWEIALAQFLDLEGERGSMNASALLRYFDPLWQFLQNEIEKEDIYIGWPPSEEELDDLITDLEEISAIVPIIVGIVLAVLVCIVLVAFFVGQRKRKKEEKAANESLAQEAMSKVNEAMEMNENDGERV